MRKMHSGSGSTPQQWRQRTLDGVRRLLLREPSVEHLQCRKILHLPVWRSRPRRLLEWRRGSRLLQSCSTSLSRSGSSEAGGLKRDFQSLGQERKAPVGCPGGDHK